MNTVQRRWIWAAAIAICGSVLAFIPTSYHRTVSIGTDTYEAHRIFLGERTLSYQVPIQPKTNGIAFIIVTTRKKEAVPIQLSFFTSSKEHLFDSIIPANALQDDTFAWATFPHTLTTSDNQIVVELKAPTATSQSPLGLRLDLETQQPALQVSQQVPVWKYIKLWSQDNKSLATYLRRMGTVTLSITAVLLALQYGFKSPKRRMVIGCAILFIVAILLRLPTLQEVKGVFGGDAFNYFFKASAWIQGYDPFAADPRKGPIYSLLILPGLLTPDPLLWGKLTTITASAATAVIAALLLAALSVPTVIALAGGLLLAVNRQLWWESVHSLANITFGALILYSLFLYIRSRPKKGEGYALGLTGALIALTRFEGILVPAILLPSYWASSRFNLKILKQLLVPLCILLAIPFLTWPFTGQVGIRTWSDIESDGGLSLAHSIDDFKENLKLYRLFIGRAWVLTTAVGPQTQAFVLGLGTLAVLAVIRARFKDKFKITQPYIGVVVLGTLLVLTVLNSGEIARQRSLIFTYLTGIGAGYLLTYKWKFGWPLLLIFISQSFAITWILPKERYYIHLLPIMGITLMVGLFFVAGWHKEMKKNIILILLSACIVSTVYWSSEHDLHGLIDKYNEQAQENTIQLDVARILRPLPGSVAAAGDYLPLRLYLTDTRLKTARAASVEDTVAWLTQKNVSYVVDFDFDPIFAESISTYPDKFELMHSLKANGYKANIYKLRP
jgi:hypothetical protein